jgi:predicted O-methyltransferase YrrM
MVCLSPLMSHRIATMATKAPSLSLQGVPCPLLHKIFASGKLEKPQGGEIPLQGNIGPDFAAALYGAVKAARPKAVVEVGMASGISSLAILAALQEIGEGGRLISVDPFQNGADMPWAGIGIANVQRAGFAGSHTFMETYDYLALPQLIANGQRIQFAYIDGWHTFDYTLLDFFFVDKMMDPNGVVGFNDCGWRAVNRALGFLRTHRKYTEIDVGIAPNYHGRNPAISLARRLMKFSQSDRYFRKQEQYEPQANFYARF